MRKIGYNSQRGNATVNGIHDYQQCFATSVWMALSWYAPDKYKAEDDKGLAQYVAAVTAKESDDEYEWEKQRLMMQKYLDSAGIKKTVKLGINLNNGIGLITADDLVSLLAKTPVVIGTKKMGGLPGGHIILGVDNCDGIKSSVWCNDPYGDARTKYKETNGKDVSYSIDMFDKNYPSGPVRCMWAE